MDAREEGLPRGPFPCPPDGAVILYLDVRLPARLRDAVQRHYDGLARLAGSLRATGLDEHAVRDSLDRLVDAYRDELIAALDLMDLETADG